VATIGTDCQLIVDGIGYWIEPSSYQLTRPRVRRADMTGQAASPVGPGAGAGERYIDRGPGKRDWKFIVVAFNNLTKYDGTVQVTSGQAIHDTLQTSYNKVNTVLVYNDPNSIAWNVRFDDLVEQIVDVRSQIDGIQYYLHVTLVEA
jgi:hypothetical protein